VTAIKVFDSTLRIKPALEAGSCLEMKSGEPLVTPYLNQGSGRELRSMGEGGRGGGIDGGARPV